MNIIFPQLFRFYWVFAAFYLNKWRATCDRLKMWKWKLIICTFIVNISPGAYREFVNSGKLRHFEICSGIFLYQMLFFRDAISNTQQAISLHSYSSTYVNCWFYRILVDIIFCNSARKVPKV